MGNDALRRRPENTWDRKNARAYRDGDELHLATAHHARICGILGSLTASFGRPVDVCDMGCGCGRYFHCLKNTRRLVGIDISQAMLDEARNPVMKDGITAGSIELVRGDLLGPAEVNGPFDLVYSVGVLGEYSPFGAELCRTVHGMLNGNGVFFFTVVDRDSRDTKKSLKRAAAGLLYPLLTHSMKRRLDAQWSANYLTRAALESILEHSPFPDFSITRQESVSPYWKGAHFEVTLVKKTLHDRR